MVIPAPRTRPQNSGFPVATRQEPDFGGRDLDVHSEGRVKRWISPSIFEVPEKLRFRVV